ncbi:DUF3291 domain-containing protein [Clavibacter michiganensis subsp. michiganensis]|nr:DUF3291 domain-containing protein [Clavibacter michiganensis subsp. michiganensis]MWJ08787.1 DUF3291 domain-containing protein [Clavibacter michiganensis subsp. michiganensis]MWJ21265.1 DUF3291 domain-containing protein [Clavibacter michiganensis subsp. michiganensis]MWJ43917.1 DUF3291 domain-containing protein [Clavibacter michiganensis subsp. michiganensis]QIT15973.1 DUF3291 domain-containing protein [Clavibacter michiganensis subsp. michiganensis]
MASRFELTTVRAVPAFFVHSIRAWLQARRAAGNVGVALHALPLKREFWTLSAWESKEAIYAYARQEPHATAQRSQAASMRSSVFVFWEAPKASLPAEWPEARTRVHARLAER